jgi:hypothetical protein
MISLIIFNGGSTIGDVGDASPPTGYAVNFFIA